MGHVLALLYRPDESWAPTIVDDLLGLAAALLGSLVANDRGAGDHAQVDLGPNHRRAPMMRRRRFSAALCCIGLAVLALAGCGDDDEATTTTSAADDGTTATATPGAATVASVVAATQAYLDDEFAANPDPPPEVLGAIELSCDRSGEIRAGDLLACLGTPRTQPGFELDPVGVLFAILDDAGTVAWATGTDLPDNDEALGQLAASATPGLFCRDLVDPAAQAEAGFFDATTTTESFGYFLSVVYWFIEGRPGRMDEDGNGIPCETVHDADVVVAVWRGGPVG